MIFYAYQNDKVGIEMVIRNQNGEVMASML